MNSTRRVAKRITAETKIFEEGSIFIRLFIIRVDISSLCFKFVGELPTFVIKRFAKWPILRKLFVFTGFVSFPNGVSIL